MEVSPQENRDLSSKHHLTPPSFHTLTPHLSRKGETFPGPTHIIANL